MSRAGSIKRDGSGKWMFTVDIHRPGQSRRQVRRRGFATKAAAVEALDEAKREVAHQVAFVKLVEQHRADVG